ncbi:MAG: RAMP superfamily CRISPR-associated protein [Dethiobacteria bacterium]
MQKYRIQLELTSPCLPGAGEGWGSVIDTDLVFDSSGLPYFPARRLKGALRESAVEVMEMMQNAKISYFDQDLIKHVFGTPGDIEGGKIYFSNLHLPQYDEVSAWCRWALQEYNNILSPDVITNVLTEIRQQTSINEDGLAENHSLRTVRVLKTGLSFEGEISLLSKNETAIDLLALSCANLHRLGTMRNRGFGRVKCSLLAGNQNIFEKTINKLEKKVG